MMGKECDIDFGVVDPNLPPEQAKALKELLVEFSDCFATKEVPYGRAKDTLFHIDTGDHRPIKHSLRPTAPREREVIEGQVNDMLKQKVIRPSNSEWAFPVTLVPKPDGSARFCINYVRLNAITTKDVYPLPRITDMLESLSGKKYFSTLDAAAGY